jgi:hypothetical protein
LPRNTKPVSPEGDVYLSAYPPTPNTRKYARELGFLVGKPRVIPTPVPEAVNVNSLRHSVSSPNMNTIMPTNTPNNNHDNFLQP